MSLSAPVGLALDPGVYVAHLYIPGLNLAEPGWKDDWRIINGWPDAKGAWRVSLWLNIFDFSITLVDILFPVGVESISEIGEIIFLAIMEKLPTRNKWGKGHLLR